MLLEGFTPRCAHPTRTLRALPTPLSVIEAPEEVRSGFTPIAATAPHFHTAVQAIFEPHAGAAASAAASAAAGAAVLPGLTPKDRKRSCVT